MKKLATLLALAAAMALAGCAAGELPPWTTDNGTYLALHTPDYRERTVSDFDNAFAPYRYDYTGYGRYDPQLDFKQSLYHSLMQLIGDEDGGVPCLNIGMGVGDWVVSYDIHWQIDDPQTFTVGDRDDLINTCRQRAETALSALSDEQLRGPDALIRMQEAIDSADCALSVTAARAWVEAESADPTEA